MRAPPGAAPYFRLRYLNDVKTWRTGVHGSTSSTRSRSAVISGQKSRSRFGNTLIRSPCPTMLVAGILAEGSRNRSDVLAKLCRILRWIASAELCPVSELTPAVPAPTPMLLSTTENPKICPSTLQIAEAQRKLTRGARQRRGDRRSGPNLREAGDASPFCDGVGLCSSLLIVVQREKTADALDRLVHALHSIRA